MKPGERSELAESEQSERCQCSELDKPVRAITGEQLLWKHVMQSVSERLGAGKEKAGGGSLSQPPTPSFFIIT